MTREQHLQWCKDRALELLRAGKEREAFASMCSDLTKHEDTADHCGLQLGLLLYLGGCLKGDELERWITGFN